MAKQEYIEKNKAWLVAKAQEQGVKALDSGIYYKVLKSGNKDSRTDARQRQMGGLYSSGESLRQTNQPGIPGGSTLIFELELINVM